MNEKDNFERRLLTELRQVVAERPEPAAKRTTRRTATLALGGGTAAVAVAAVAIVAGGGGSPSSAYAVEKKPDGAVTVEIKSLKDAPGLEAKLNEVGVPAVVDYTPAATLSPAMSSCAKTPENLKDMNAATAVAIEMVKDGDGTAVKARKLEPAQIEAGASGGRTEMSPVVEGTTFTIDPADIKDGEKLYVTGPARADAEGFAATITTEKDEPGC